MDKSAKEKLEQSISTSWLIFSEEFKKYNAAVELGFKHVQLLVAHRISAKSTESSQIEDTDTFKLDPDIKLKLQEAIRKEIFAEEKEISNILIEMSKMHLVIIKQCDKVFSMFKSLENCLSLDDLTQGNEMSLPISRKLDALNSFRKFFSNQHQAREYTIEYCYFNDNLERLCDLWSISSLLAAEQDLECIIAS